MPSDKTYELWWITEKDGPVQAGLFKPDERGLGRIEATIPTDAGAIQAAAVTVEAAGGVPKPQGPMVLLGNSHKATPEDVAKAGGQRNEIDDKTGKRVIFQHGGGQDMGVLAD